MTALLLRPYDDSVDGMREVCRDT
ncbi:protein of unknown function [Agreia sp. COWG]|nr:protein of unknown function [Agreia sp. COWG]